MTRSTAQQALVFFFALILLAGCGQKGPLRLPDEPADNSPNESQEQAR